jgi:GDP-L-fucose synthase
MGLSTLEEATVDFTPGPIDRAAPVFVAGHRGMVGSAIHRKLQVAGFSELMVCSRSALDLRDRRATFEFFGQRRPHVVILAAGRVGGILANSTRPVDFISENLQIQVNVLDAALHTGVSRLLFLGSAGIYPQSAPQPITEDALLTGPLAPTNDAYAIAKIAGILHVQAVRRQYGLPWISAMPTNVHGPGDNFSPVSSHVLPALIRRYDQAHAQGDPVVINWGSGRPRRDLLHVDDLADACLHLLERFNGPQPVNVGSGEDHTIADIADVVATAIGYLGETRWDTNKPDGAPRKLLDVSTLRNTGWRPNYSLIGGIVETVSWYRSNQPSLRS